MIRSKGEGSEFTVALAAPTDPSRRAGPSSPRRALRGRHLRRVVYLLALAGRVASADTILDASFTDGPDGFAYVDDAFLGTHEPDYATGAWIPEAAGASGVLEITLGDRDSLTVKGMSGGWSRSFVLDGPVRDLRIKFRVALIQAWGYEPDEFSQVMVLLDGAALSDDGFDVIARIEGDGDAGSDKTTGWLVFSSSEGAVRAGRHVLTIGGYNNKKTVDNESTRILIDDVRVTGIPDVACQSDSNCDDANPCTDDFCESGRCVFRGNTSSCPDGFRYGS
jgi:hypothetical protein